MWKDGFSVDGGPLRRYDDPANKQFLDEITQGRLPMELRALGTEVNVSMEDRRKDDYEENKPKQEFKVCLYSFSIPDRRNIIVWLKQLAETGIILDKK